MIARVMTILALSFAIVWAFTIDVDAHQRLPFAVPGASGSSETVVKALDFPNIPALKRRDGRYIDLGYLHRTDDQGAWVGYIGSSTKYVPLDRYQLKSLLLIAGVDGLPPVPSKPLLSGGNGFWIVLILIGVVLAGGWKLLKATGYGSGIAGRRIASVSGGLGGHAGNAGWDSAQDKIRVAAEKRRPIDFDAPRPAATKLARPSVEQPLRSRGMAPSPTLAPASGFGRRGRRSQLTPRPPAAPARAPC